MYDMIDISQDLQDFGDVVTWARHQPERFDVDGIVIGGTSFEARASGVVAESGGSDRLMYVRRDQPFR